MSGDASLRSSARTEQPASERVPLPLAAIPRATYRVQLQRDFGFADVTAILPYLAALGVSHVYCSPYLRARPGSLHGYDIVDHGTLNPELGSPGDFDRMVDALAREGMSHVCDVVPNHMAVMRADNAWWMDVLANGPSSPYATYFDIDFGRRDESLAGKVLVPVLGDGYGDVLERGEIALAFEADSGTFVVRYFDHRFPLDPRSTAPIVLDAAADARRTHSPSAAELDAIAHTLQALPAYDDDSAPRVAARRRIAGELAQRLAGVARTHAQAAAAIARSVARFNGHAGDRASFDPLHALLEQQPFRLADWRIAADEINYRRFFDVNDLAGLRMERPEVFAATHAFVLSLAGAGRIGGLRVDHPDGLYDPARYFAALQDGYRDAARRHGRDDPAIYLVIEKIAAPHERVPVDWPVHGTTGYRFASVVNGLFVDGRAKARLDRIWRTFAGDDAQPFEEAAYAGRRAIMEGPLASELRMATLRALRLARADRRTRDFTFNALREAIMEIVARFPVYRTYVDANGPSAQDRRYIDWAVAHARAQTRVSDVRAFDFLHRSLLGAPPDGADDAARAAYRDFAMRFQQFTAPVTAKGVEDTALYRFNRLVALNDVGADPQQFGMTVRAFHAASADRAATWPHTMLATSTHDNKRSEDVRARIDVISERPGAWRAAVMRWSRMNRSLKTLVDGVPAPSANDEYLLYQTLVGSFAPDRDEIGAYRERIAAYMCKAVREAKVRTSWLAPNAAYEDALARFVAALLDPAHGFLADLQREYAPYAWFGMLNSLSATLLKLASPGVPDIYQGNELFDFSLVDPDNRRPVDFGLRKARLASLATIDAAPDERRGERVRALFAAPFDGRTKLFLVRQALALRRQRPALFARGDYRPLQVQGTHAAHVVAFARVHEREAIVAVAGRLFASLGVASGSVPLGDVWSDTSVALPVLPGNARIASALTGRPLVADGDRIAVSQLFADYPGALLHVTFG